jgi:hypothetical protein
MTELTAFCFEVRLHDDQGLQSEIPESVRVAIQQMRLYYSKPIRVAELIPLIAQALPSPI